MEEMMRLQGDAPFGWMLSLQTWLSKRAAARRTRNAAMPRRPSPAADRWERTHTGAQHLADRAAELAGGWRPDPLARIGDARLRLFRVDDRGLPAERHPDLDEAVLMLEGEMTLELDGRAVALRAGDFQFIAAGRVHAIRPGGVGAFLSIKATDPTPPAGLISVRGLV